MVSFFFPLISRSILHKTLLCTLHNHYFRRPGFMLRRNSSNSLTSSSRSPGSYYIVPVNVESSSKTGSNTRSSSAKMNADIPSPPRSESMAYASARPGLISRVTYFARFNTKMFVMVVGAILIMLVMILDAVVGDSVTSGLSLSNVHGGLR